MLLIIRCFIMEIMRKDKYVPMLISIREGITFLWVGLEGPEIIIRSNKSKME